MKNLILPVLLLLLLPNISIQAQEWNAKQKEVWKVVEEYNNAWMKGDVDAFMAYFHPEYKGWHYSSIVPSDKATTHKYVAQGMKTQKVEFTNLTPMSIQVYDNFAIVNYLFHDIVNEDGKISNESGRWTDVLMKKDGKWMIIADHGGQKKS